MSLQQVMLVSFEPLRLESRKLPVPRRCFKPTYIPFPGFRSSCRNNFVHKHLCNISTNVTCPTDNLQLKHASPTGCSIGPRLHQTAVLLCSGVLVISSLQNLMTIQNYLAITYPYITYPVKLNSCFDSLMLALITSGSRGTSLRISTTGNKIVLKWGNFGDKTTPLSPLLKLGCFLFCTDSCSSNSGTTLHGGVRERRALLFFF